MSHPKRPNYFKNGDIVRFEFAPHLTGRIIKYHVPEKSACTYDVELTYDLTLDGIKVGDTIRLRDLPGKCLLPVTEKS